MYMGPVQRRVFVRAGHSGQGNVMPANFLERRACRRLERRALLKPALGLPDVWRIA